MLLLPNKLFPYCEDLRVSEVAANRCNDAIVDLIWSWRGSISLRQVGDDHPTVLALYVSAVNLQHQFERSSVNRRFTGESSVSIPDTPYARVRSFIDDQVERNAKRRRLGAGAQADENVQPRTRASREEQDDQTNAAVLMEIAKISQVSFSAAYTLADKLKQISAILVLPSRGLTGI